MIPQKNRDHHDTPDPTKGRHLSRRSLHPKWNTLEKHQDSRHSVHYPYNDQTGLSQINTENHLLFRNSTTHD
jgi:hypothetical protein